MAVALAAAVIASWPSTPQHAAGITSNNPRNWFRCSSRLTVDTARASSATILATDFSVCAPSPMSLAPSLCGSGPTRPVGWSPPSADLLLRVTPFRAIRLSFFQQRPGVRSSAEPAFNTPAGSTGRVCSRVFGQSAAVDGSGRPPEPDLMAALDAPNETAILGLSASAERSSPRHRTGRRPPATQR